MFGIHISIPKNLTQFNVILPMPLWSPGILIDPDLNNTVLSAHKNTVNLILLLFDWFACFIDLSGPLHACVRRGLRVHQLWHVGRPRSLRGQVIQNLQKVEKSSSGSPVMQRDLNSSVRAVISPGFIGREWWRLVVRRSPADCTSCISSCSKSSGLCSSIMESRGRSLKNNLINESKRSFSGGVECAGWSRIS